MRKSNIITVIVCSLIVIVCMFIFFLCDNPKAGLISMCVAIVTAGCCVSSLLRNFDESAHEHVEYRRKLFDDTPDDDEILEIFQLYEDDDDDF